MQLGFPPRTYVALLALALFIPLAVVLGRTPKRSVDGSMLVFLLGIMFLPEHTNVDPPLIPAIGKHELASGLAMLTLLTRDPARFRRAKAFRGIEVWMVPLLLGAVLQVVPNRAPVMWETSGDPIVLQALTLYDGISNLLARLLFYWAPFHLGRLMVQSPDDLRRFIRNLVLGALLYSIFSLIEQVISPQLHRIIYGFHQHEFLQTRRMGGWRPMIFMRHGLVVAMYMLIGASAAIILMRVKDRATRVSPTLLAMYQGVQLVLMKSTGALLFGMVSLPVLWMTNARTQLRVAVIFVVIILAYPTSKLVGIFPAERILTTMRAISGEQRTESLGDRFRNDAVLVDRAKDRLLVGWGGYRRSEIFNRWGIKESVPDATWVILIGHMGLMGLAPFYIMLCWPVISLRRHFRRIGDPKERLLAAGLAVMIVSFGFDLLLNSMQNGLPMLLPGALAGLLSYYRGGSSARTVPARRAVVGAGVPMANSTSG